MRCSLAAASQQPGNTAAASRACSSLAAWEQQLRNSLAAVWRRCHSLAAVEQQPGNSVAGALQQPGSIHVQGGGALQAERRTNW